MKKTLKILSIAILICFASSNLGITQTLIKTKTTLIPDSDAFYDSWIGIDTPTIGQKFKLHLETRYNDIRVIDVKLKNSGGFQLISGPEIGFDNEVPVRNIWTLRAPESEGKYVIVFEGESQGGNIFHFDTEIKVVEDDPGQTWLRIGVITGIVVLSIAVLSVVANSGK